ncbi:MAG: TIGR03619 family F420-dependent LLM class oxidoreductase [Dehalococcoidia bacterium]|nr:TIGR03619 family F420-dependent LLM class oxidoreductase [Dehalococcoidia bacterium]
MQFGVNLLNFGPGVSPSALLRWALIAESLGYHFAMICDHVAITTEVGRRYPEPFYDAYATLSWLAGQTKQIKLGTTVIVVPYRHPVLMARLGANLDNLSGGRFIFGVGVGNARTEYAALGIPFHRRGAIADEYLSAIKALWTGKTVSFSGRYVSFQDVSGIDSLQKPHPPIWVGGSSDAALKRAVRFGEAWHPIRIRLDWLRNNALPRLRKFAEESQSPVPALAPRIRLTITATTQPEETRQVGEGTIDQVRRDLEALGSLGASHVLFDWYTGDLEATRRHESEWSMLALLADQVLNLEKQALR